MCREELERGRDTRPRYSFHSLAQREINCVLGGEEMLKATGEHAKLDEKAPLFTLIKLHTGHHFNVHLIRFDKVKHAADLLAFLY